MSEATLIERLKTDLGPRTKALDAGNEKQKPALLQAANGVMQAVQEHDRIALREYAKSLQKLVADYATLDNQASVLVADFEAIKTDDPQELKLVHGLYQMAKTTQGKISRNYAKLKEVMAEAHAGENDSDYDKLMKAWAEMEAFLEAQKKVAAIRLEQMKTMLELAKSAVADGDAKSLAQAQQKAKDRHGWRPNSTEILARYAEFKKGCDKVLGSKLSGERARDIERFRTNVLDIAKTFDKAFEQGAQVETIKMAAAKPAKLDTKKAAAAIGVDEAKLKKAWGDGSGDPEKRLDALAKDAKLKAGGKQLLATLQKAKLL